MSIRASFFSLCKSGVTKTEGEVGDLLCDVAAKFPESAKAHRPFLVKYIVEGKLNRAKNNAALSFFKNLEGDLDQAAFETAAGVGIEVDDSKVEEGVRSLVSSMEGELKEQGYGAFQKLMKAVKDDATLKWADGFVLSPPPPSPLLVFSFI